MWVGVWGVKGVWVGVWGVNESVGSRVNERRVFAVKGSVGSRIECGE